MPKLTNQMVGQAGKHFVAAELHRRGAHAVTFAGNTRAIDLSASDANQARTVSIQVKTKTAGTWQTTTRRGARGGRRPNAPESTHFALPPGDMAEWRGRWDRLGILPGGE